MVLQFQASGAFPGALASVRPDTGQVLWFGTVSVQGAGSRGQSGVEWIIFASQPLAISNAAGGVSGSLPNWGIPSRIRYAAVLGGTYINASGVIKADIASGGIPDILSGGRPGVSGLVVAGQLLGAAIGIQWYTSWSNSLGVSVSNTVSGQNLGVLLIGD